MIARYFNSKGNSVDANFPILRFSFNTIESGFNKTKRASKYFLHSSMIKLKH